MRVNIVQLLVTSRLCKVPLALRNTVLNAVAIRLNCGVRALLRLADAAEIDNFTHRLRRYFSIAFLKAGRATIRAVYSFSTSVSGVILNSIM